MDPLTAALQLANTLAQIVLTAMQGQTPEQRAIMWQRHIDFLEKSDAWWDKLLKLTSGASAFVYHGR